MSLSLVPVLTLLWPAGALAACGAGDAVWNGGVGNWNSINFWTTTGTNPPNSTTPTVCIDNGNAVLSIVSVNIDATINNLILDSDDLLVVQAPNTLNGFGSITAAGNTTVQGALQAPSFTNTGTVVVSGSGILNVASYTQTSGTTTVGYRLFADSYTQAAGDTTIQ